MAAYLARSGRFSTRLENGNSRRTGEFKTGEAGLTGSRISLEGDQRRQSLAVNAHTDGAIALEELEGKIPFRSATRDGKNRQQIESSNFVGRANPHRHGAG